jgi:hypothetical protein
MYLIVQRLGGWKLTSVGSGNVQCAHQLLECAHQLLDGTKVASANKPSATPPDYHGDVAN